MLGWTLFVIGWLSAAACICVLFGGLKEMEH